MTIRIGTRSSALAMWQAEQAQSLLRASGYQTEIVCIQSQGDLKLDQPIYAMGITGVFTKALDTALINDQIDVAVHSLKDVPTELPQGLKLTACLPRGEHEDIVVYKDLDFWYETHRTVATGSLRRQAFWHNRFPDDKIVDLRGNVQLRIKKLKENKDWDAAIFAKAGLARTGILGQLHDEHQLYYDDLNFMVSAPSQGIVGLVSREDLDLQHLSHVNSARAANIERTFLNHMQAGCTAPIGCFVDFYEDSILANAAVLSVDGSKLIQFDERFTTETDDEIVEKMLKDLRAQGADMVVAEMRNQMAELKS
ncbi:MAG: hydroxymethylbilane synthase [Weeksellaceae bacterium]|nr:hydroxymethylbilane synthase [Weeksellaceae bacterium]